MNRGYAIFILSHGRADNVVTVRALKNSNYTGKVYILIDNTDKQAGRYREIYGEDVIVFDKIQQAKETETFDSWGNLGVALFAHNAVYKVAKQMGIKYFIVLDDDYTTFGYRIPMKMPDGSLFFKYSLLRNADATFNLLYRYYRSTPKISILSIAQGGDYIGGSIPINPVFRKAMNFFFSCTDRPIEFKGTFNDDVNSYIMNGQSGKVLLTIFKLQIAQIQSQTNEGGVSEVYHKYGTYVKSFYSVIAAPSCVCVSIMMAKSKRLHHRISWENAVPKILSEDVKKYK